MTATRSDVRAVQPAVAPEAVLSIHPHQAAQIAARLRAGTAPSDVFDESAIARLPEPARRWLTHAIEPGTPLYRRAELTMHGEIRLGRWWHPFVASQVIAPDTGFVWAARARVAGLPVVGYDSYSEGAGTTRWRVFGLPLQSGVGSETTLSAVGRLAAEAVLVPTSRVTADWQRDRRPDTASYYHHTTGRLAHSHVTITVGPDGRLVSLSMRRWGLWARHSFGFHRFVVDFDGERRFGSVVVPDGIHASWPDGRGEFFRAHIDQVTFGRSAGSNKGDEMSSMITNDRKPSSHPATTRVADVLRPAVAVPGHASFKRILRTMIEARARAVPVVDTERRVIGIVSDADLLSRAVRLRTRRSGHHHDLTRHSEPLTAAQLMTAPALTTSPDEPVDRAARALADAGVRQLVVVNPDGRLLGLVGRADLITDLNRDDRAIYVEVVHDVLADQFCIDPTSVAVSVQEGVVTVRGQVEHHQLALLIGDAIAEVPGVLDVDNRLTWPEHDRHTPLSAYPVPFHAT